MNARDLASVIFAGIAATTIAAGILALVVDFRGLCAQLDRDQRTGYRLSTEAKPKSRPCPPWINRAKGRVS